MRKSLLLVLGPALLFASGLTATAQQTSDVPVTSTIKDYIDVVTDPSTGQTQRIPMQIQGDGAGPYQNTKYVQSLIQGIGDWELDAYTSKFSNRKVYLDFSQPIAGSGPNGGSPVAPFTSGLLKARFISKCHEYGNSMFSLAGGAMMNCPLIIRFDYGGGSYRMHMNPVTGYYVYPETNFVNITCTGTNAATGQCNQWKIEPSGACVTADCAVRKNVVKLAKLVTSKGQEIEVNQGDFHLAFSFLVTNP